MTRITITLITSIFLLATGVFSEEKNPATVLSRQFVDAVNANSPEKARTLIDSIYAQETLQNIGYDKLLGQMTRLHGTYSPLTLHHGEITGQYLHLYAKSKGKTQWHDFQMQLDDAKQKIVQLVFIADVTEPVYLPNGAIYDPGTQSWLQKYIDTLASVYDLSAGVLVAHGDNVVFERYVGHADAAKKRKTTAATRFSMASTSKLFTALAIMKLAESGKLALDDPLTPYFSDFPDKNFAKQATIRQLLSHTSGLGDFFGETYDRMKDSLTVLAHYKPLVYDDSIAFKPGTGFQYSNSGFLAAGFILEQVTGKDYYEHVASTILNPIGMPSTAWNDRTLLDTLLPENLSKSDKGWVAGSLGRRGSSAGGCNTTLRDMLKFARALVAGKIVSQKTLQEMTRQHNAGLEDLFPYGLGFTLRLRNNRLVWYGHGGIAGGVNFEFRYYPAEDITLITACNQDNGAYDDLLKNVDRLITGDR